MPSASDQFGRQLLAGFHLHVRQHNLAAVLDEHARGRRAQARRAAGDNEYLVFDLHTLSPLFTLRYVNVNRGVLYAN
jgi:hypothetical protein